MNSSNSLLVDGCVVYKTSGDNFQANHSKIITQASDNISASYNIASSSSSSSVAETTNNNNLCSTSTISLSLSSPLSLSNLKNSRDPSVHFTSLRNTSTGSNSSSNHSNEMVLQQHHLHHSLIDSDYHDQNSPVSSSDTALLRSSLIYMYSPYTTVTSSSSPPQNYHQIVAHRPTGDLVNEVIADTLKDEHCTMIDGMNNSPNGVLVSNVDYNGNHSAANSDDGENNSRSPHNNHLSQHDEYDGIQNYTHLTNATDTNHSALNRESVYSGTALFTPNSSVTTAATSSIIHPIQTYESVLHPATPGRYVNFYLLIFCFFIKHIISRCRRKSANRRKNPVSIHIRKRNCFKETLKLLLQKCHVQKVKKVPKKTLSKKNRKDQRHPKCSRHDS